MNVSSITLLPIFLWLTSSIVCASENVKLSELLYLDDVINASGVNIEVNLKSIFTPNSLIDRGIKLSLKTDYFVHKEYLNKFSRYVWILGGWGPCTKSCESGHRQKTTACCDTQNGKIVQSCNFHWITSEWEPCLKICGSHGIQNRELYCLPHGVVNDTKVAENSIDFPWKYMVSPSKCGENPPPNIRHCNRVPCPSNWEYGNWFQDTENYCRYRDNKDLYPPEIWRHVVAGYCYNYTLPSRRRYTVNMTLTVWPINGTMYPILAVVLGPNNYTLFDHESEVFVNEIIAPSFKLSLYVDQWLECVENAIDCCERFDDDEYNTNPTEDFPCPALWDGWACWKSAKADTTLYQECPIYSFTSGERICELFSYRQCLPDGIWLTSTDNDGCAVAPIYRRRHNFHIITLYVSIALTMPAIILFFSFSKLREAKDFETFNLPLYRNLLICIVVKNILTIVSKKVVILDSLDINSNDAEVTLMEGNGVWCRILAFVENVSKNTVFTCMVVVGYYLHISIARFFADTKIISIYLLYLGVLVVSLIPSLAWATVMAIFSDDYCWMVDNNGYQWITDSYKFFVLAVNLLLLLDIVRVLIMGRVKRDVKTIRSAVKATLFLIPLFGVPLLLTGQRSLFETDSCSDVYFFVTYIIEGSQSVIVAILFCYLNKKVHNEIKKKYRKFVIYMDQRYNITLWRPAEDNRKTATTNVRFSTSVTQRQQNQFESFS